MRAVPCVVVSLWLGAMAFFAFIVAPAAFGTLEREQAGRLVSAVFPRYYAFSAGLGVIAVAACLARPLAAGGRARDWLPLGLALSMLCLTLYAWMVILPAAHAAREAAKQAGAVASAEAARFARLHRVSSLLNGLVMIAGAMLLVTEVVRRP
jgi:uncharacterized membrane protein